MVATPEKSPGGSATEPSSETSFDSFLVALAASPAPYRPPTFGANEIFAGRYRVERELGRGGMGTVHLAYDTELERRVALKVAAGRSADAELERLQQEARVMAGLADPGIVTVYEAGEASGHVYIAMAFVPGGTLRDWMDVGGRRWREVARMFSTVAQALCCAHDAGIVHRDFKPHNVLLDLDGRPQIADFGLARRSEAAVSTPSPSMATLETDPDTPSEGSLTRSGAILGTPAYMAPEQARGEEATSASDQFAFCVSLYEALTGQRPFRGRSIHAVVDAIESGPPAAPPGIPRALCKLLFRGLRAQADDRYPSMRALATELDRILLQRRRRIQTLGIVTGLGIAATFGFASAPAAAAPCALEDIAGSIEPVWNDRTRTRLVAAAGEPAAKGVDDAVDALLEQRETSCSAHKVEQTISDEDFSLHSFCLDRAQSRLQALVQDLVDAEQPRTTASVKQTLPNLAACQQYDTLRGLANRRSHTSKRTSAESDRAYLEADRLFALVKLQATRGADNTQTLAALETIAAEHGFDELRAYSRLQEAAVTPDPTQARTLLDEATALAAHSTNTELLADLSLRRSVLALQQGDIEVAAERLEHAEVLARLNPTTDDGDRRLRALVGHKLHVARGESGKAIEGLTQMLEQLPEDDGDALEVSAMLADALTDQGRIAEARAAYKRALAHPQAVDPFLRYGLTINRAIAEHVAGDDEAALRSLDEAASELAPLGDLPASVRAPLHSTRATSLRALGQTDEAAAAIEQARVGLVADDPDHPLLSYIDDELGLLARARGDLTTSREALDRALARWQASSGPRSVDVATTLVELSDTQRAQNDHKAAEASARRALEIFEELGRPVDQRALAWRALAHALEARDEQAAADARTRALDGCRGSERAACRVP